ncbi:MAG TPA: OmpH family outer membrane protein, partial [Burkholderiales bacterium]|nr:OmpH family outer membrane protein [Burkholderiales bacterium]
MGAVNIAEVFDKYEMTKGLEEHFEHQRQALAERAQARRDEMDAKRRALLEQFKPDTAEFEERQEELERMQVDYEVWAGVEEKRLKKQHKHWLMTIYRNVREQVRQVAEMRGIDMVLTYDTLTEDAPDSQALRQQILLQKVIYSSPRVDL